MLMQSEQNLGEATRWIALALRSETPLPEWVYLKSGHPWRTHRKFLP
jgi:ribosomal protein L39E